MPALRRAAAVVLVAVAACSAKPVMESYVPARCHGAGAPFSTYETSYENVPGFIHDVLDSSLRAALNRQGLAPTAPGLSADVRMHVTFAMIRRGEEQASAPPDGFGEPVATDTLNRFVAHTDLDLYDNRTGELVWKGAMDRAHAVVGDETFHDERAVITIGNTLDDMFRGITTPCP